MSESSSRVLSFIQRAKQLTDSAKTSSVPQTNSVSNSYTANPAVSRIVPSPAESRVLNVNSTSVKIESITQTRIPSPANGKSHKASMSQVISPTFKAKEKTIQFSRKGTPVSNSPIPQVEPKPAHKSSTSQIFFPSSPSTSSSRLPLPRPLASSTSSSYSKISPLAKKKNLSIQSTKPLQPASPNPNASPKPILISSKPQTPNHSSYSRSSTPKSAATPLSASPTPFISQIPKISESKTHPAVDPANLDPSIENLVKIRSQIDDKLREQQTIESQMIQIITKKLEKVKNSESRYENIEKAKVAYKEKFESFVEKTKAKLIKIEKKLSEVEAENFEIKGKLKNMKSFPNCAWFGRQVQEFDVKVKNEDDLDEILDEQVCFLGDDSKSGDFYQLNVALCKKWLIEHSKLAKAELNASVVRREEEALIDVLEEKLRKAEKLDVI